MNSQKIFDLLIGCWFGQGIGMLQNGDSFNYCTNLSFTRCVGAFGVLKYEELAYVEEQGQYRFKHGEVGYLMATNRCIHWNTIHHNGRIECMVELVQSCCTEVSGKIVFDAEMIQNNLPHKQLTGSRRELIRTTGTLQYNQYLSIKQAPWFEHLKISLHRTQLT